MKNLIVSTMLALSFPVIALAEDSAPATPPTTEAAPANQAAPAVDAKVEKSVKDNSKKVSKKKKKKDLMNKGAEAPKTETK